jgi:hypothetical protein
MAGALSLLSFALSARDYRIKSALRADLAAAEARSPCARVATTMPMLELAIKPGDGSSLIARAAPVALLLSVVVGSCTGDHDEASRLASQLAEAPDHAAAVATLRTMRALMLARPQ